LQGCASCFRQDAKEGNEVRPLLSPRDNGVERLIAGFPIENTDDAAGLRLWASNLKRAASGWEVERAKEGALNRLAGGRRG
jgi:hypothetical protein